MMILEMGRYVPWSEKASSNYDRCMCEQRTNEIDGEDISLAPCPICGGLTSITEKYQSEGMDGSCKNWLIRCHGCGIEKEYPADAFYGRTYFTKRGAITKWNSLANRRST